LLGFLKNLVGFSPLSLKLSKICLKFKTAAISLFNRRRRPGDPKQFSFVHLKFISLGIVVVL
jgi:hypothetical protein